MTDIPNQRFADIYKGLTTLVDIPEQERPTHLAHYTSMATLEKILRHQQIWMSHPFFMNDHQEMVFGLATAVRIINDESNTDIFNAHAGDDLVDRFRFYFNYFFGQKERIHLLDYHIFCLSKYDTQGDGNGKLSMWRGYGDDGGGAAIVFSTDFVQLNNASPLMILEVKYQEEAVRHNHILQKVKEALDLGSNLRGSREYDVEVIAQATAFHLCEYVFLYALSSKALGFKEEEEWRVVYMPDRDKDGYLKGKIDCVISRGAIASKLKFPLKPLPSAPDDAWTLETIIDRIILGPTQRHPVFPSLATDMAKRLVECLELPALADKIYPSSIPYRSTGIR
jgi:hypothetical protein